MPIITLKNRGLYYHKQLKKMKKTTYIALGLLMIMAGCKKNTITQVGDAVKGTQIKLIHAAPGAPALDGFINNTKVSAATTYSVTDNQIVTSIVTGFQYLNVFPGSNYSNIASGNTAIRLVAATPLPALVSKQTVAPGAVIGDITQATADGSAYSAFAMGLQGSATAGLTVKVVEDKFPPAEVGKAFIRFAAMVPNGAAVDVTATTTLTGSTTAVTKTIITGKTYGTVTDFVSVDVNPTSTTNYTFQMLLAGTTTKFGTVSAAIALSPGRYYTIIGRGLAADYVVPGAGITLRATTRPTLPVSDPATRAPEIYYNPAGISFYTNK